MFCNFNSLQCLGHLARHQRARFLLPLHTCCNLEKTRNISKTWEEAGSALELQRSGGQGPERGCIGHSLGREGAGRQPVDFFFFRKGIRSYVLVCELG